MLLGNCVIELCVRRVTGELCYRFECGVLLGKCVIDLSEACFWGTTLKNCRCGVLLENCVIELWVWRVTGKLNYRIVGEARYWETAL